MSTPKISTQKGRKPRSHSNLRLSGTRSHAPPGVEARATSSSGAVTTELGAKAKAPSRKKNKGWRSKGKKSKTPAAVVAEHWGMSPEGDPLTLDDIEGGNLREMILDGVSLRGFSMADADLTDTSLDGTDFTGTVLDQAVLFRASMLGACFDDGRLRSADLSEVRAHGASFSRANLTRADFEAADLTGARFDGAKLHGADFRGADLSGATFLRADLRGARFDRSTRWPDGFELEGRGLAYSSAETLTMSLSSMRPGRPYPLGATWDGMGVNFAISAQEATHVELCLFDDPKADEASARIRMPEQTDGIWHIYIAHLTPGQLYGYRVYGPYRPERGLRFNSNKLLIDPYAKALSGPVIWDDSLFGYTVGSDAVDLSFDERNSAGFMPKSVVIDSSFPWEGDRHPRTPLQHSLIYELHVKGFTKLHPGIPEHIRGTYAAIGSQVVIEYLKSIGVTAVELLPVHEHVDDHFLGQRGLSNYWGYNTLGFFAPNTRYKATSTPGAEVREFKAMVKALHAADMEVILDVVYNHTAEGNHLGPTLCFKGLDNNGYYRTVPGNARYYMDYTGCGNTINSLATRSLQLMMDSLRYWVTEMHVDGFRFDLAAALTRGHHEGDRLSAFLDVISQDPVLSQVKLIAEPWDVGPGGYQVGQFPSLWSEWNGKYRDTLRKFWKGDEGQVGELAYRISGSSDLFYHNGRKPYASINFITSHDGFTLCDLVSYNDKHNEANHDNNTDGDSHNNSWNCGVEGKTTNREILRLRAQQMRNLMGTLLLSQGVPMILAGDERGRTQFGNNNGYCQDGELSWIDWSHTTESKKMLEFTRKVMQIRKAHPALRRRNFFFGRRVHGADIRDLVWIQPSGSEMPAEDWSVAYLRCLGMLLNGEAMTEWAEDGSQVQDQPLLLLLNAHHEPISFMLPSCGSHKKWTVTLESEDGAPHEGMVYKVDAEYPLAGRAMTLLTTVPITQS